MICVSKENEIKTKMEQEQSLQLKILFLLGYNLKVVAQGGGGMRKFLASGGETHAGKTPHIYIYIYIYIQQQDRT